MVFPLARGDFFGINGSPISRPPGVLEISIAINPIAGVNSDYFSWIIEGTFTPTIPGPHIDVITPSDSQYLFALFGSGFTAEDVIEIDGSVIFTKQLHGSKTWFILLPADGSVKAPFHVRLTNSSGTTTQSTIAEIPPDPFANY